MRFIASIFRRCWRSTIAAGGWHTFTAVGITAGAGLLGTIISTAGATSAAEGTAAAQQQANQVAAQNAAAQSAQSFYNYLSSRGVDIHAVLAQNPDIASQIGSGDPTAIYNYLQGNPTSPLWAAIANPTAATAQNTTLPNYATIGGQPAQAVLAGQVGTIAGGWQGVLSQQQQSNPDFASTAGWVAAYNHVPDASQLSPQQWASAIQAWYQQNPGTPVSPADQQIISAAQTLSAAPTTSGTLAPATNPVTAGQVTLANTNLTSLLNGTNLAAQQGAVAPAQAAALAAAGDVQAGITQQRSNNAAVNTAELTGLQGLLNANTAGTNNIYAAGLLGAQNLLGSQQGAANALNTATLAGAQGLRTSQEAAAQGIDTSTLAGLANLLGIQTQGAHDVFGASTAAAGGLRSAQQQAAQGIDSATLSGLANLLGISTQAAQNLFAAQNTGAQNVYGAQLTQADTYAESAREALNQQLAEQQANAARQGFIGTSSGANLERARLMEGAIQAGAGARAGAGVSLQQTLANNSQSLQQNLGTAQTSNAQGQLNAGVNLATALGQAGTGYATNVGNAGINQANTISAAQAAQAQGQLTAGVNLATALGAAGTGYATNAANAGINLANQLGAASTGYAQNTGAAGLQQANQLAAANSQYAAGQLSANTQLAQANAPLLNATGDAALQQAAYNNAMQNLSLLQGNQSTQLNASNAPFGLATSTANLNSLLAGQPYANTTAAANALAPFGISQASGSGLTTSNPGAVTNTGQIVGAGLSALGQGITSTANTGSLLTAIQGLGSGSSSTANPSSTTFNTTLGNLGQNLLFGNTGTGTTAAANNTGLGSITSGNTGLGFCWVAREVYGILNPKWIQFREWMMHRAGDEIRDFYRQHGERIADLIRGDIGAKLLLRSEFDRILSAA